MGQFGRIYTKPALNFGAAPSAAPKRTQSAQAAGPRLQSDAGAISTSSTGLPVRSVREVNALVSSTLQLHLPEALLVLGEISNLKLYDSGHAYFTLKDGDAELSCVMWKDNVRRLKFRPRDGLKILARGAVKMYEATGRLQLYVDNIIPQGAGELELAFRQLCEKLRAEGMFDAARKRPLPRLVRRVAVLTSRSGHVLHDVLTTAWRRFPGLHVMLFPVPVQGAAAAAKMATALDALNQYQEMVGGIDVILLVRGGGSLEDLWPFNEEILARAIVASRIPIATGIGHEPDTTIADLVGDLRGATPTAVTELVIADAHALRQELANRGVLLQRDLRRLAEARRQRVERSRLQLSRAADNAVHAWQQKLERLGRIISRIEPRHALAQSARRVDDLDVRLRGGLLRRVRDGGGRVDQLQRRLEKRSPCGAVPQCRGRIDGYEQKLHSALRNALLAARTRVAATEKHLLAVGPEQVLNRGYSITRKASGEIVRHAAQVSNGDILLTRVAEGEITSTAGRPKQGRLFT